MIVQVRLKIELFNFGILRVEVFAVDSGYVTPLGCKACEKDVLQMKVGKPLPSLVKTPTGLTAYDVSGAAHK